MKKCVLVLAGLTAFGCGENKEREATSSAETTVTGAGAGGEKTSAGATGGAGGAGGAPGVKVQVVNQYEVPMTGVPVVVNSAEGGIVEEAKTDATGVVTLEVPEGGSVSAFYAIAKSFGTQTAVAPPAGGVARFQFSTLDEPPTKIEPTTFKVTLFGFPAETAHLYAALDGPCDSGSASPGETITLSDENCSSHTSHDLVVVAQDSEGNVVATSSSLVSSDSGKTVKMVVPVLPKPAALSWTGFTLENIPLPASDVFVASLVDNRSGTLLGAHRQEHPYEGGSTYQAMMGGLNLATHGLMFVARVTVMNQTGTSSSSVRKSERKLDPIPGEWTFDAGATRWVYLTSLETSEETHPTVTWSTTAGFEPDAVELGLSWSVGPASAYVTVQLPPDHTNTWRMPDVPEELSSFRPTATTPFTWVRLDYEDFEEVDGYADVLDGVTEWERRGAVVAASARLYPD